REAVVGLRLGREHSIPCAAGPDAAGLRRAAPQSAHRAAPGRRLGLEPEAAAPARHLAGRSESHPRRKRGAHLQVEDAAHATVSSGRLVSALPDYRALDPAIEGLPVDALRVMQAERLHAIARYAYDATPFWRRKFDEAGIVPGEIRELSDLGRVP